MTKLHDIKPGDVVSIAASEDYLTWKPRYHAVVSSVVIDGIFTERYSVVSLLSPVCSRREKSRGKVYAGGFFPLEKISVKKIKSSRFLVGELC